MTAQYSERDLSDTCFPGLRCGAYVANCCSHKMGWNLGCCIIVAMTHNGVGLLSIAVCLTSGWAQCREHAGSCIKVMLSVVESVISYSDV